LPIGAFVKIYGEDEKIKDKRSFSEKSVFQRTMILSGGVVAFWIVAFIILTLIAMIGVPTSISDDVYDPDAKVMITKVWPGYPAETAEIMVGDVIKKIDSEEGMKDINKAGQVNEFISGRSLKEKEIEIVIAREGKEISIIANPNQDGIIGVGLARVAIKNYSFYEAPWQGLIMTGNMTYLIVSTLKDIAFKAVSGEPLPSNVRLAGPVAIVGEVFVGAIEKGLVDYLTMVAILSISLAIFNLLPIPALDGGRIILLIAEKIKGSPLNPKFEKPVIAISFFLLIGLLIFITINDIQNLIFKN
jgi:regulator of sigma E protease